MNDFSDQLARSHTDSDLPMWEAIYRKAFPLFASMLLVKQDGWAQRAGIDRIVSLSDGTQIKIDEKCRQEDWPDVLLEVYSDRGRKTPGWMNKPLNCDFIAYAFLPSERCYLLPYQTLRLAWKTHRTEWIARYPEVRAENRGYTTVSCPVPIDVLMAAMSDVMMISWTESAHIEGAA